eukprot:2198336-Pyramimonas_sp.AAC.1
MERMLDVRRKDAARRVRRACATVQALEGEYWKRKQGNIVKKAQLWLRKLPVWQLSGVKVRGTEELFVLFVLESVSVRPFDVTMKNAVAMLAAVREYWGHIFRKKDIDEVAAREYIVRWPVPASTREDFAY